MEAHALVETHALLETHALVETHALLETHLIAQGSRKHISTRIMQTQNHKYVLL